MISRNLPRQIHSCTVQQ